jgi:large subunit ribosomal protein L6
MVKVFVKNLKKKLLIRDISKDYYRLNVLGAFGAVKNYFRKEVSVDIEEGNCIKLHPYIYTKETKSLVNSYGSILKNAFRDANFGFSVLLEVRGVGAKVQYDKGDLIFNLGYSHSVKYRLPEGIIGRVLDDRGTLFLLMGNDRVKVLATAAKICLLKKKDVYKGKGIFFYAEEIALKEGKGKSA